jgi:hypothetical protein
MPALPACSGAPSKVAATGSIVVATPYSTRALRSA